MARGLSGQQRKEERGKVTEEAEVEEVEVAVISRLRLTWRWRICSASFASWQRRVLRG